jgi:hypothetical protein
MFEGTTPSEEENSSDPILIEFTKIGHGGTIPVGMFSIGKKSDLIKKSDEAVEKAIGTIQNIAERVNSMINSIENKPTNVEMEFGIKFDAEMGAIVAKVTAEGSMKVKLTWNDYSK